MTIFCRKSKFDWRLYAIYRLEHWGLSFVNNIPVNEEEILEANKLYGSLGELSIMVKTQVLSDFPFSVKICFLQVMPQYHINSLIRKFELCEVKDNDQTVDYISMIKDPNIKEILAKETLQWKPPTNPQNTTDNNAALANLVKVIDIITIKSLINHYFQVGHSSFHKIGKLESEWPTIMPILIKRIVLQYSDITRYKKESLCKLERP